MKNIVYLNNFDSQPLEFLNTSQKILVKNDQQPCGSLISSHSEMMCAIDLLILTLCREKIHV